MTRSGRNKFVLAAAAALLALLGFAAFRIAAVNRAFPAPNERTARVSETLTYGGKTYTLEVFSWRTKEEMLAETDPQTAESLAGDLYLVAEITVRGGAEADGALPEVQLEIGGTGHSALHRNLFRALNDVPDAGAETLLLPFELFAENHPAAWPTVREQSLEIVFSLYPEKIEFILQ